MRCLLLLFIPAIAAADASALSPGWSSPNALAGPFASLADSCGAVHKALDQGWWDDYGPFDFACLPDTRVASVHDGSWEARAFVSHGAFPPWENGDGSLVRSEKDGLRQLNIAVHTNRGWYVAVTPVQVITANRLDGVIGRVRFDPRADALLVRMRYSQSCRWGESGSEALLFIGVGPSGTPSSIGPIVIAESGEHSSDPKGIDDEEVYDWMKADWSWEPHALMIKAVRESAAFPGPEVGPRPAAGRYPLEFR